MTTTTHANTARQTTEELLGGQIQSIVDTFSALEIINDAVITNGESYPVTLDRVTELLHEQHADETISDEELALALNELKFSPEFISDDGRDVFENYLENVLSIEYIGKRYAHSDEWELTEIQLTLTYGGPNIYAVIPGHGGDNLELRGYWSPDRVSVWAFAPGICEYARMLGESA
jgi:hypothetical protein